MAGTVFLFLQHNFFTTPFLPLVRKNLQPCAAQKDEPSKPNPITPKLKNGGAHTEYTRGKTFFFFRQPTGLQIVPEFVNSHRRAKNDTHGKMFMYVCVLYFSLVMRLLPYPPLQLRPRIVSENLDFPKA